jgi:hypothetical protein
MPGGGRTAMKARAAMLRASAGLGALIGYGCLIGFLYLVGMQIYHWFRDGEWTHVGLGDGLRIGLARCCGNDLHAGKLANFLQWLDSPVDWLGLHRVVEVMPASLALFLVSMAGNCLFIYSKDRVRQDLR